MNNAKLSTKKNQTQKEILFGKTNERKNNLVSKINTFVPFLIRKGKKKKTISILNKVISNKKKYKKDLQNFNEVKNVHLEEIFNSTVPYINTISLKTAKRNKSNSKIQTLPIKRKIQQRLQASWIFPSQKKKQKSISFDQSFLNELKTWETNKEKFLQSRNLLYKTALQSQEEDEE